MSEEEREEEKSELLEYYRGKIGAFSKFVDSEPIDADSLSIDEIYEILDNEYRMNFWI